MIVPEDEVDRCWPTIYAKFMDGKILRPDVDVLYADERGGCVVERDGLRLSFIRGRRLPVVEVISAFVSP